MSAMGYNLKFLLFLLVGVIETLIQAQDASNMMLEQYYLCPNATNTDAVLFISPKNFKRGQQMIDLNISTPYPIGKETIAKVKLELQSPVVKTTWLPLFQFEDQKGHCHTLDAYVGEPFYRVEDVMGIPRKVCPFPKGKYHAFDQVVDYSKLKLQSIPFGRIRITVEIYHTEKKKVIGCNVFIMSNVPQ